MLCNSRQVPVFREVLSNESVGILIQTALPGGIRMREIDTRFKIAGHAFVVGKFPAIVISDGMHPIDMWGKPICDGVSDSLGCLVKDEPDDGIQRFTLDQRDQGTPVALADHGITLPVTEAPFGIHNGRALINRDLVRNRATPAIDAIALASDLLTAQVTVQVTT